MSIYLYSLMCYGLTAAISFLVVGMIVLINKVMSKKSSKSEV